MEEIINVDNINCKLIKEGKILINTLINIKINFIKS